MSYIRTGKAYVKEVLADGSVVLGFSVDYEFVETEETLREAIDAVYQAAGGLPLTKDEKRNVETFWKEIDAIRAAGN